MVKDMGKYLREDKNKHMNKEKDMKKDKNKEKEKEKESENQTVSKKFSTSFYSLFAFFSRRLFGRSKVKGTSQLKIEQTADKLTPLLQQSHSQTSTTLMLDFAGKSETKPLLQGIK